jgi:hypothetical protein
VNPISPRRRFCLPSIQEVKMRLVQFLSHAVKPTKAHGGPIATLVAGVLVLTLSVIAAPASAQKGLLLENWSLGETVIYCDNGGALHAAMIIKVRSEKIVDLEATEDDGSKTIIREVAWNDTLRNQPNSWWRRIKT